MYNEHPCAVNGDAGEGLQQHRPAVERRPARDFLCVPGRDVDALTRGPVHDGLALRFEPERLQFRRRAASQIGNGYSRIPARELGHALNLIANRAQARWWVIRYRMTQVVTTIDDMRHGSRSCAGMVRSTPCHRGPRRATSPRKWGVFLAPFVTLFPR